jgi:hypothetical protein
MNQTWVAISMMLVCLFPVQGHRISPLTSCAAGFAGGFLIPAPQMKPYFAWLFYINPNFYGYASMMRLIMPDIDVGCNFDSTIECYPSTGKFWLEHFGFQFIQPFLSLVIMMIITAVAFLVAWMALEKRYRGLSFLDCILHCRIKQSSDFRDGLPHRQLSEENSIRSGQDETDNGEEEEEGDVNSEEEFNVVAVSEDEEESGPARVQSPISRYNDARGLKKRNRATEEELQEVEKKVDEMATMKTKRKLQRQTTRTLLLPSREHSVFRPEDDKESSFPSQHPSFSRMSRRDRLRTTAREMQMKQEQMKSRMLTFKKMQDHLAIDPTDLASMNHAAPLGQLKASMYSQSGHRLSPGTKSLSSLDPWKTGSADNIRQMVHHTSSWDTQNSGPRTFKSMAELRRGSESSGVSFDVSRLAPGSDSETNTPIHSSNGPPAPAGRRASVTFAMDFQERQRSSSPSPLIPKSAMKRPKSLQNTPNLTPEGTPSPRPRKKTKSKTTTPDVDPDVSNTMTARTRQRFGDRPFQIHRRITEGEHENSFEGVTVGSSDDESLHQKPKKRSKPSLTQLASEVAGSQELIDDEIRLTSFQARSSSLPKRHTCGVIPSGSGNNDPLMQDHSVATSSGGEERKGKVRRPSQLSLHSGEMHGCCMVCLFILCLCLPV